MKQSRVLARDLAMWPPATKGQVDAWGCTLEENMLRHFGELGHDPTEVDADMRTTSELNIASLKAHVQLRVAHASLAVPARRKVEELERALEAARRDIALLKSAHRSNAHTLVEADRVAELARGVEGFLRGLGEVRRVRASVVSRADAPELEADWLVRVHFTPADDVDLERSVSIGRLAHIDFSRRASSEELSAIELDVDF